MEWAKIRSIASTVRELAGLLPEDSASRQAVTGGQLYWEEILEVVEKEMSREESWGESDGLYWKRLNDVQVPLLKLVAIWSNLTQYDTVLMPLENQDAFVRVLNLRRRRTFEVTR